MMKKLLITLLVFAMALSIIPTAFAAPASPLTELPRLDRSDLYARSTQAEETESNDDFDTADPIWHEHIVVGLMDGQDTDVYVFTLTKQSYVAIVTAAELETTVITMGRREDDYGWISDSLGYDEENGVYGDGLAFTLPAGTYYIAVQDEDYYSGEYYYAITMQTEEHIHEWADGYCTGCGIYCGQHFVDIPYDAYYITPVEWAAANGITAGTDNVHFSPSKTCTRAEVVTFLWRANGCPAPTKTDCAFTDVAKGSWYYDAMLWAVEKGITKGTSATTFAPTQECSRAEVVTFLHRAEGSPAPTATRHSFTDVVNGSWYCNAMLWAVEKGITQGTGDGSTFSPAAVCDRAQVVTFLYRAQ